jgi:glycosyltransferase involved in cell wall biosynthesis
MTKASVGIVHHFFAHYREPILKELSASTQYNYWFVGDKTDSSKEGIRPSNIINHPHFVYTPTRFFGKLLFQQGLLRFALRKDIDAIIYLGVAQSVSTWFSAILARLAGKKVFYWSHGWTHDDAGIKNIVRCSFYRLGSGGMMLYGIRARKIGIKKGFDPKRLYVIYNSLDYEECKRIRQEVTPAELELVRRENFTNPNLPMIICSSRLVKERRLDLLLDALGILRSRGNEVNALIVGGGDEKNALEQKAHDMVLPVKFLGACYDEKILARLFMASNVTVVPSYLGLTAIHSLGYGTPVIANDNPELNGPEWEAVQPGVNGDIYRYEDVGDLANKIFQWIQLNDVQKDELRARCIHTVEQHYTPKAQREAIEYALSGKPASII